MNIGIQVGIIIVSTLGNTNGKYLGVTVWADICYLLALLMGYFLCAEDRYNWNFYRESNSNLLMHLYFYVKYNITVH